MANATASACTLVNTALVIGGALAGSFVAGMTITAAGVPPGVTIVSQSTGPAGGAGVYVASASTANVNVAEPMTFSLSWVMPLIGTASAPQIVDMNLAAGFSLIVAASLQGPTATPGAEYHFGTHQAALYNAQAGTKIFPTLVGKESFVNPATITTLPQYPEPVAPLVVKAATVPTEVKFQPLTFVYAAPQLYDPTPTLQPFIDTPQTVESLSNLGQEYHFGTHQKAYYDSQNSSIVWPSLPTPLAANQIMPLRTIQAQPQEIFQDLLTPRAWLTNIPLNQGWVLTFAGASPQSFDFTLQSTITEASPFTVAQANNNPTTSVTLHQPDLRQIQPQVFKPSARTIAPQQQPFVVGAPDRADFTQPQGVVTKAAVAGPAAFPMRPTLLAPQQAYVDIFPTPFSHPVIGTFIPPPPPTPTPNNCTKLWDFSGNWNWDFSGFPGWSWDGYEPTPLQCAVQALASVGANVGTLTYAYSSTVPLGWVITGYVPFLNVAFAGQYIPLTISQGPAPPPTNLTVPNVVGKFYYDAQLAILDAGFLITEPTWALSKTVLPQYVISQSIPGGTVVTNQTMISIVVSGFTVLLQPGIPEAVP